MTVNGYLTDFSLSELFQLFERGRKTGLLTITPNAIGPVGMPIELTEASEPDAQTGELPEPTLGRSLRCHYIWFYRGRIVASSSRLDQKELGLQLQSLGWLSERMALKLDQVYPRHRPLGAWLKAQGVLTNQQLQKLFYRQVIRQVSQLLRLKGGRFQFYSKARLPFAEMTGISLPGSAVILQSLRRIQDWSSLITRLPAASSALISCRPQGERLKLSSSEWHVWEYTNGLLSLQSIADQRQMSVLEVRKIAYRLILSGLAEERVQDDEDSTEFMTIQYAPTPGRSTVPFFQSLVGFIRSQAQDAQRPDLLQQSPNHFTGLANLKLPDLGLPELTPESDSSPDRVTTVANSIGSPNPLPSRNLGVAQPKEYRKSNRSRSRSARFATSSADRITQTSLCGPGFDNAGFDNAGFDGPDFDGSNFAEPNFLSTV
jgi:hypothetical protein